MVLQTVDSSLIYAIGYDKDKHILEMVFFDGRICEYRGVPQDIYDNLMLSNSKGRFYHANIRHIYDYRPLNSVSR